MAAHPFKICDDNILGRHLVTTRPIESGAVILQEAPLVRGPFLHTVPVCLSCGKILDASCCRPCSKCGWPVCDKNCEQSPTHQSECILTAAKGSQITIKNFGIPNPNYQFVSILRALYLKQTSPEKWKKLLSFQSHSIELEDWSEEEIAQVLGVLLVNGHELPLTQPSQLVVYDEASFLEHNCRANCTKTFTDEGELLVVASKSIEQGDHLSICYTDPFWGVQNRRQHLHQTKHFWCVCSRCEDPAELDTHLNSIKCPKSTCDGLLLSKSFLQEVSVWICDKCDGLFSNDNVDVLLGKIGGELSEMPKGDAQVCREFLQKYEKVLAPNHFYLLDVKMALSHILASQNFEDLSDGDLGLLLKMSEDLKIVAERVAPAERRLLGLILYRTAKSKIEMARREDNLSEFRAVLANSKATMSEARLLLANEPSSLPEGRLHRQIGLELRLLDDLLKNK